MVLLKKETRSFILRLLNALCQLNSWIALLISSVFPYVGNAIFLVRKVGKMNFQVKFCIHNFSDNDSLGVKIDEQLNPLPSLVLISK